MRWKVLVLSSVPFQGGPCPPRGPGPGSPSAPRSSVSTEPALRPPTLRVPHRPGSLPRKVRSSLHHHRACSPSRLRAGVTAPGKPCLSLEEPPLLRLSSQPQGHSSRPAVPATGRGAPRRWKPLCPRPLAWRLPGRYFTNVC